MKILSLLALGSWTTEAWKGPKEHEVIAQFMETGKVTLVDDERTGGRQWHECGDKPSTPKHAQSVECSGPFCVSICKQG